MYDAGNPKPALCDRLERWGGEGSGRGLRGRGHMHAHGRPMWMCGENCQNITK